MTRYIFTTVIVAILAILTLPAFATPLIDNNNFLGQVQGQLQNQGQMQNAAGGNGAASIDVRDRLQIPPAAAVSSSSSNTTAPHRYLEQDGFSILFFSKNGTKMKFDVVSFISSNPTPRQELAACSQEPEFRKFRKLEGNPCPE